MSFEPKQRPLIIGQAPARGNNDLPPFSGQSGKKLAILAGVGLTGDVLPNYFDLENLISRYPGKSVRGKGDSFDLAGARLQAGLLMDQLMNMEPRWVLLMGRSVANAFYWRRREYLRPWPWYQHRFVIFPHPSGVNRWYNDPKNWRQATAFIREVMFQHEST